MPSRFKQAIPAILLVAAALLAGSRFPPEAAGHGAEAAGQWEYKVVDVRPWLAGPNGVNDMEGTYTTGFNRVGPEGWEYAGIAPSYSYLAVFKRPKR